MRMIIRGAGALAALLLALLVAGPAWAAASLTLSPASGPAGTKVTATYTADTANGCSVYQGDKVDFSYDGTAIGSVDVNPNSCSASVAYTVPRTASCTGHVVKGVYRTANGPQPGTEQQATFTVTCPRPSPTASKPAPRPTQSATARASASPTPVRTSASPTPSPTPTATATATPGATATATATAAPSAPTTAEPSPVALPAPGDGSGGSRTPWLVGGGLLALGGLGVGLGLLAPRGAPKLVVAGTVVAGLAGGGALAALTPVDPPTPLVLSSYAVSRGVCEPGDIPLTGGYHAFEPRTNLLHFHPQGTGWNADTGDPGPTSVVCLKTGTTTPWAIREKAVPSNDPRGSASCQSDESLVTGGFYFPWGVGGMSGSHPAAPARWTVAGGPADPDLPATYGHAYALCARLPVGTRTYTVFGSTGGPGEATARCYPGDAVLTGGWAGKQVHGNHPVDGGWVASFGPGGGTAHAVCFTPGARMGLKGSYVASARGTGSVSATCGSGDALLGGGWEDGHDLDSLRFFEPVGSQGWTLTVADDVGGEGTVYALCGRPTKR